MLPMIISHGLTLLAITGLTGLAGSLALVWRGARHRARRIDTENRRLRHFAAAALRPAEPEQAFKAALPLGPPLVPARPRDHAARVPPSPETSRPDREAMARHLRHAIEHDELSLHYQAVCNAETLSVMSYEALLRWKSPLDGGFVAPGAFIPVAEATGTMPALGRWALQTACAEAASWPERRGVSLNLSVVQVQDAGFAGQVGEILARTGLPAGRLELEISEHLLQDPAVPVLATLHGLRELGIRIALDDFGSSADSLAVLRRFPFDRVKIHRSFVVGLGTTASADATILSIIEMARGAGLYVTATGIETEPQLAILRALHCNHLQGFLLGRPAPASSLLEAAAAGVAAA